MERHYELIEKYGYRETLIGRYATEEQALAEKELRDLVYKNMRITHGELIVREAF